LQRFKERVSRMAEEKDTNLDELEEETSEEEVEEEKDKKYSYSDIHELREEAKGHRLGKAAEKRKRLEVEAELKKLRDEKLSDSEKKDRKIIELDKQLVDIQTEYKEKEIDNLILTVASGKNFADMEVVKLLAKKELEDEEDPDQKTVEKVIEKIAKEKPYLISEGESGKSGSGNFAKKGMESEKDPDVLFGEMIRQGRK